MLTHLACIMDGNRRWAMRKSLQPWIGHNEGVKSVKTTVNFCLEKKIKHLSLYTFSLENFKRSAQEQSYLFSIIVDQAEQLLPELIEKNIRVYFIGDQSLFPASVKPSIEKIEHTTREHTALIVYILFCYGGQQEIIAGVKAAAHAIANGILAIQDLNCDNFTQFLWSNAMPSPDLIIRTGGVQRLSNFLLLQSAYSELYFTDCLWPDISVQELEKALNFFNHAKRNFGK